MLIDRYLSLAGAVLLQIGEFDIGFMIHGGVVQGVAIAKDRGGVACLFKGRISAEGNSVIIDLRGVGEHMFITIVHLWDHSAECVTGTGGYLWRSIRRINRFFVVMENIALIDKGCAQCIGQSNITDRDIAIVLDCDRVSDRIA